MFLKIGDIKHIVIFNNILPKTAKYLKEPM